MKLGNKQQNSQENVCEIESGVLKALSFQCF